MQRPKPPQFVARGRWPGLVSRGNIDLRARAKLRVPNPFEGGYSSVYSTSFNVPGVGEVLIPRVIRYNGKWIVAKPALALAHYKQTGRNLGVFRTVGAADRYAGALHRQQERMGRR